MLETLAGSQQHRSCAQAIIEGESAEVDGYLIDLRNNPGGVFEEAIAMASYFLDTAPDGQADPNIVETVRASDATHHNVIDNVWTVGMLPRDVFSRHAWGLTSRPLAIITNRGTASASEVCQVPSASGAAPQQYCTPFMDALCVAAACASASRFRLQTTADACTRAWLEGASAHLQVFAGALQDNHRGIVIGERTFGKGVVQFFFKMSDGSAHLLLPSILLLSARFCPARRAWACMPPPPERAHRSQ